MPITHIYNKDLKKIVSLNYSVNTFRNQPNVCYPDWTSDMYATDVSFRYPKLANGSLEEKTRAELVEEGIEELKEGEVIQGEEIIYIPCPEGLFRPKWVSPEWTEEATEEEIAELKFKKAVKFYNEELEFASKATAELACEIISVEVFKSVKDYMKEIDPYVKTMKSYSIPIARPAIFNRYK